LFLLYEKNIKKRLVTVPGYLLNSIDANGATTPFFKGGVDKTPALLIAIRLKDRSGQRTDLPLAWPAATVV